MASWRCAGDARARAAGASASGAARGCPCRCGRCRAATAASGASSPRSVCVSSRLRCVAGGRSSSSLARSHRQRAHVRQRLALRVLGIAQQRGGGGLRGAQVLRVEAGQRGHAAAARTACAGRARCRTARPAARVQRRARCAAARRGSVARGRPAPRPGPAAPASRPARARCIRSGPAAPLVRPSQARPQVAPRCCVRSASSSVSALSASSSVSVTVPGVTTRTTLRSTGPLAVATSPTCSADRHRLAQLDQPRQVALDRMHRHAGHHHRLAGALAARGQRDVEQPVAPCARRRRTARRSRPSGRTPACPGTRP